MNEAIISPWFFYWVDVIGNAKTFAIVLTIFLSLASFISFCVYMENIIGDQKSKTKALKYLYIFAPGAILTLFFVMFIPSSDALYKMMIAKSVTPQALSSFIKDGKLVKDELKKDIIEVIKTVKETK